MQFAGAVGLRGDVDAGILVEEAHRHQLEAGFDAGLHRKILRPGLVVQAKDVPEHQIGILQRPILLDEIRHPA